MARFFIVEDEPVLQSLYSDLITMFGHDVLGSAGDGVDCLAKLSRLGEDPDYILMDHRMPVKNGLDTTRELLARNPRLKVIFISSDAGIENEAMEAGALGFLMKPFNAGAFLEYIERLENNGGRRETGLQGGRSAR